MAAAIDFDDFYHGFGIVEIVAISRSAITAWRARDVRGIEIAAHFVKVGTHRTQCCKPHQPGTMAARHRGAIRQDPNLPMRLRFRVKRPGERCRNRLTVQHLLDGQVG